MGTIPKLGYAYIGHLKGYFVVYIVCDYVPFISSPEPSM